MAERSMKAAVWDGTEPKVSIATVPVPKPQGRELLVRVKCASLCHSDISIISGLFGSGIAPLIIGHEAVSVVEELGPDAMSWGFKVGDLIGAPLWQSMCLKCTDCRKAGPHFCPTAQIKGLSCPGYFAEYTTVDPASAVVITSDSAGTDLPLQPRDLAPLFCAGVTVWDALEQAKLKMGETVAIVGVGGLGQLAVQYASKCGSKVIGLDVRDEQLQSVKEKGYVHEVINLSGLDVKSLRDKVRKVNNGELADAVIVTSGVVSAYQSGLSVVRSCGNVVAVGLPHGEIPIDAREITGRSISLIGSRVPGQASAKNCLDFTLRTSITPMVNKRKFKLEDINEMIELMKAGDVSEGRMVVDLF